MKVSPSNRRDFLRTLAAGTFAAGSATLLAGCEAGAFDFLHGVASGDPQSDRVMLWTRITPDEAMLELIATMERATHNGDDESDELLKQARRVPVQWEVARDEDFRHVVSRGVARALSERDYTV